jgi:CRP-like cAMP-binding protein
MLLAEGAFRPIHRQRIHVSGHKAAEGRRALAQKDLMAAASQSSVRNRLLAVMSPDDFARLQPYLQPIILNVKDVLVEPNTAIEHVYFMEEGLASVVAVSRDGEKIEVGHEGREGLSGKSVLHGVDRTPNETFIQVAGSALRMRAHDLRNAMEQSSTLRSLMLRFTQYSDIQVTHSALANGRYTIQQRLARWLLMSHDRIDGDDLPLTHEFLSLMLGVRRSGVTEALHLLEGVHIVEARRGHIRVLNRAKLEEIAGGCYGVPEAEYKRLIG